MDGWLAGAGVFWRGGWFSVEEAAAVRSRVRRLFIDSGAQQFYRKFKGFAYPYSPKQYLEFTLAAGADLIAT
ncbi:MAG: hypothetical protein ACP5I3_12280, partial [Thermoproteus sp.]